MGTVWRAYSEALGVQCALKMLLPDPRGTDERQRLRLFREARIVAKLRSPYIVTVYDVGEWEGGPFIAMELLEGQSLRQWLARTGPLSIQQTVELVRQVALGLDKAHSAGLVHRDLKPDNIYVLETQPLLVKILDFGIAKQTGLLAEGDLHTTTGVISGTPLYMSPEQANASKHTDFRSDLWSLAVICFECLTGRVPFTGDSLLHLMLNIVSGPMPVPSQLRPSLPAAFDEFWARAASRDPARRPPSALALAEGLRDASADVLQVAAPEVWPKGAHPVEAGTTAARRSPPTLRVALWLVAAATLCVLGYRLLRPSSHPVETVAASPPPTAAVVNTAPVPATEARSAPPPHAIEAAVEAPGSTAAVAVQPPAAVPSDSARRAPESKRTPGHVPRLNAATPPSAAKPQDALDDQLGF